MAARWSPFHLRLHRQLLRRPELLPRDGSLLLAVSGGQDSMALAGLLLDLRRLHGWRLELWHGDHRWRNDSGSHADGLAQWAQAQGLTLHRDCWAEPKASEAAARQWRYRCLERLAADRGSDAVATGHTASDRAETLLLNLSRGCHRRGLASLPQQRPLGPSGIPLVRPLLIFERAETATICQALELPVWLDASNTDPRFSRNRIRREVMPVLNALHPGVERRLSGLAERLAAAEEEDIALLNLALQALQPAQGARQAIGQANPPSLDRRGLLEVPAAAQRRLLSHWLKGATQLQLAAEQLTTLLSRLQPWEQCGEQHLADGWRLHWQGPTLWLTHGPAAACDEPHT